MAMNMVKFNVGGYKFETSNSTIAKYTTMLENLVKYSNGNAKKPKLCNALIDDDGYIVIDRDGRNFHYVLNFLRDGSVALPDSAAAVNEILAEANFYSFEELKTACLKQLFELNERDCERFCRCVYTQEELKIVIASKKPIVVMSYCLDTSYSKNDFNAPDAFYKCMAFFKEMRPQYPQFCFVIDISKSSGNFFKFDFYHDGKRLNSLNIISYTGGYYFYVMDDFKTEFYKAMNSLFGSVASSLDTRNVTYFSK